MGRMRIECTVYCLYLTAVNLYWAYRILPTQCVVNNPVSCWHCCQSSGWCYQALLCVYCVVCCVFMISAEFTGPDCTLPTQCDAYMCPVLSWHYCHHKVLCVSSLCCTAASAVCHCWTLPAQCTAVEHCQHSVPLLNTASAVCRCWTLQAQCAAVEHCLRSEPCGGYDKSSFHFYFHIFLLFLPILTSWEWMSTGVFNHNCQ